MTRIFPLEESTHFLINTDTPLHTTHTSTVLQETRRFYSYYGHAVLNNNSKNWSVIIPEASVLTPVSDTGPIRCSVTCSDPNIR